MKTKIILLISAVAIITLSFTFVNKTSKHELRAERATPSSVDELPGFVSDQVAK